MTCLQKAEEMEKLIDAECGPGRFLFIFRLTFVQAGLNYEKAADILALFGITNCRDEYNAYCLLEESLYIWNRTCT